jgi:hypothetical protein
MARNKLLIMWGLAPLFFFWLGFQNPADIVVPRSPTPAPTVAPTTRPPEPTPTPVPPNPTATPQGTTSQNPREGGGSTTILILLGVLVAGFALAVIIPLIRVRINRR